MTARIRRILLAIRDLQHLKITHRTGLAWCVCLVGACTNNVSSREPSLAEIYSSRQSAPLWIHDGTPTTQALALIRVLCSAESYGLRAAAYLDCPRFAAVLASSMVSAEGSRLSSAEFDRALTAAAVRFLSDIHQGRVDPRRAGFDLGFQRPPLPYGPILSQLSSASDIAPLLAAQEPPFLHYRLLKAALARYRALASGQATATRAELRTAPFERRIRQMELTLERWRWLPPFDTPPIIVNIPQFRLFAFQSTRDVKAEILQMDVIVGRTFPKLRTPVFAADLEYVVFRPYWDIPYSITQKEMLPGLRGQADFGKRQHLELVAGPGDSAPVLPFSARNLELLAQGKLRLRQQPGPDNALGLIKFMLPNTYNVYLHSTPAHRLFKQSRRTFSHGCIRVSDPVALANHVLRNAAGSWTAEAITAAMNGTDALRVNLERPVRVLILYATALAQEDGSVLFFEDIYGHDRKLEALLGLPLSSARKAARGSP